MENQTIVEALKEFGIETERELDAALRKSTFSLGIMAAGVLVPLPFGNMKGESEQEKGLAPKLPTHAQAPTPVTL